MQIFTETVIGPILEIIQRKGNEDSVGQLRALFER